MLSVLASGRNIVALLGDMRERILPPRVGSDMTESVPPPVPPAPNSRNEGASSARLSFRATIMAAIIAALAAVVVAVINMPQSGPASPSTTASTSSPLTYTPPPLASVIPPSPAAETLTAPRNTAPPGVPPAATLPRIDITSPDGTQPVSSDTSVRGNSQGIADDQDIWIVLAPAGTDFLYPQSGPALRQPDGSWLVTNVRLGGEARTFDILAVVANPRASDEFRVSSAGIRNLPAGSVQLDNVKVNRE